MAIKKEIITGIRWFTRIAGSLLVVLSLVILIGSIIEPYPQGRAKITPGVILLIIGMISMVVGIVVAWFREGLGGFLTVGGFVFFYAVHLIVEKRLPRGSFLVYFLIIGLLFIFCWWQSRKLSITET
jgi:hypothetical protein